MKVTAKELKGLVKQAKAIDAIKNTDKRRLARIAQRGDKKASLWFSKPMTSQKRSSLVKLGLKVKASKYNGCGFYTYTVSW
ncbi:MAG: hypothetical protein MN733_22225 [Nitrososphaera sp.]|nr:hypothetical protein [Nitrososphaera sp.]